MQQIFEICERCITQQGGRVILIHDCAAPHRPLLLPTNFPSTSPGAPVPASAEMPSRSSSTISPDSLNLSSSSTVLNPQIPDATRGSLDACASHSNAPSSAGLMVPIKEEPDSSVTPLDNSTSPNKIQLVSAELAAKIPVDLAPNDTSAPARPVDFPVSPNPPVAVQGEQKIKIRFKAPSALFVSSNPITGGLSKDEDFPDVRIQQEHADFPAVKKSVQEEPEEGNSFSLKIKIKIKMPTPSPMLSVMDSGSPSSKPTGKRKRL